MARYIAVIHGWFVTSNGFTVRELDATSRDQAEKEAAQLRYNRENAFDKCAHLVIEIEDAETLPRKLTLRERLTGRLRK